MMASPVTQAKTLMQILSVRLGERLDQMPITRLVLDSREIMPGDTFVALKGEYVDGREYIAEAITAGASLILQQHDVTACISDGTVPVIGVARLPERLSAFAANLLEHPSEKMTVLGVTGTNGKTSTAFWYQYLHSLLSSKAGAIGTLGVSIDGESYSTGMTTPDAIRVQQSLADLQHKGARAVVMEVSSHALEQARVSAVQFDTAIYTNLTQDHLDYHGDMSSYGAAKERLFFMPGIHHCLINIDDEFGLALHKKLQQQRPDVSVYAMSQSQAHADVLCSSCEATAQGVKALMTSPWGEINIEAPVFGEFNLQNLMGVVSALLIEGISANRIQAALRTLPNVPGRLQRVSASDPQVVVDYAHTPDALAKSLTALRHHTNGSLVCVFGCGGDRDKTKRAPMMACAQKYADRVVVTSDNPRTESPEDIAIETIHGADQAKPFSVELDRAKAITSAVIDAAEQDLILLAGKGHETYQQINGVNHPFSDVDVASRALFQRGGVA